MSQTCQFPGPYRVPTHVHIMKKDEVPIEDLTNNCKIKKKILKQEK